MKYKTALTGAILGGLLFLLPHGLDAATRVGVASAVNPQATGTPLGGAPRTLVLGKKVFYNERIKTSSEGMVQLLLLDGSAFTIGPNSELRIDKFVYDPRKKTGKMVANFVKGAFRFVGGRLSKNKGGVTIHTSIATLGVRGGVVSGRIGARKRQGHFNFLFGDEMTVGTACRGAAMSSCRSLKRVFQNGNTIQVNPGGTLNLRRTTRRDITGLQRILTARRGRNGGVRRPPTGQMVARSGIRHQNSARHPIRNAPPPRSAIRATPVVEVETVVVNPEDATGNSSRENIVVLETVNASSNEAAERLVKARILESSPSYTINWTPPVTVLNGWQVGLLGGGASTDYTDTGIIEGGRLRDKDNLYGGNIPWQTGHFNFTDGTDGQGFDLSGRGYVSPDEKFFFYELRGSNDPAFTGTEAMLLFGGSAPTNLTATGSSRIYAIQNDMFQNSKIPFAFADNVGAENPAVVSPFYFKEQASGIIGIYPNASSSRSVTLQASLLIDGTGINQRSYVMVHAGTVIDTGDGNGPRIATSLRGSFRTGGTSQIAAFAGRLDTLQGPDGNFFFGDNMENFIIGNDPQHNEAFHIAYADTTTPSSTTREYGVAHLATLTSTAAIGALPSRTSRTLNGFAAGYMERGGSTATITPVMSSGDVLDTEVIFNASTNTLRANLDLKNYGDSDVSRYVLAFGSDPSRTGTGQSAFHDDDTYAALHNRSGTSIHFSTSNNVQGFPATPVGSINPNIYFLGNELVPMANFASGVNFCDCKFLEWGYWGGRLKYEDPSNPGTARRDFAHLNTWVAGVVTSSGNWPTSGTATYAGHAIGNVWNTTPGNAGRYLAAGNFNMNWNFASRTGTASITGYDGRTINAAFLTQSASPTQDTFEGSLSGGEYGSGKLIGAFAAGPSSPVQGAIGQFEFSDTGYLTVGNIVSKKTN